MPGLVLQDGNRGQSCHWLCPGNAGSEEHCEKHCGIPWHALDTEADVTVSVLDFKTPQDYVLFVPEMKTSMFEILWFLYILSAGSDHMQSCKR